MIFDKHKILLASVKKLISRQAFVSIKKLISKTHSVDLADILESLEPVDQKIVFDLISSNQKKSEVISHLSKSMQTYMIENIAQSELVEILSHMDSDDLTDLVGGLNEELSEKIMHLLKKSDKEKVEDLLQHEEDSAGGIMTKEFLKLDENLTVREGISALQKNVESAEATFYVYVVDSDSKLVGVLSLKQILLSQPDEFIKNIMMKEIVYVDVFTSQKEVSKIVEKYDFLSVPVVGEGNVLLGAITVDDVIDVIREENKDELLNLGQAGSVENETFKGRVFSRFPWLLISFVGGLMCSYLIWSFLEFRLSASEVYICSIPLILTLGLTVSNQTVTIAVQHIRSSKFTGILKYLFKEVCLSLVAAALIGILTYIFFRLFDISEFNYFLVVSVGVGLQLFLCSFIGVIVPWILRRLQLDPAVGSLSISIVLSHLLGIIFMTKSIHYFN